MSRREIISLDKKRRLSSKDFLELYDLIWKGTAPVRYQNPERWRTRVKREGQ
jgi:hypothetical protein